MKSSKSQTHPPNYLKEFIIQSKTMDRKFNPLNDTHLAILIGTKRLICKTGNTAIRFRLPAEGEVMSDEHVVNLLRLKEVRLPFPQVALEYECNHRLGGELITRYLITVNEVEPLVTDLNYFLEVATALYIESTSTWAPVSVFSLNCSDLVTDPIDGRDHAAFKIYVSEPIQEFMQSLDAINRKVFEFLRQREVTVIAEFLNVLACENVHKEKVYSSPPSKRQSIARDSYYHLTITPISNDVTQSTTESSQGTGKREHLRRGHIRRLANGTTIWINSTTVKKGAPGRVDKDYIVSSQKEEVKS